MSTFSENKICCNLTVNEDRYPFLKTLHSFLIKIPSIETCYLSGPIVQDSLSDLIVEPIVHIYIITNDTMSSYVSSYVYKFIKDKATNLINDFFFPNYILTEVFFIQNQNEETNFKLKCCSAFWFGNKEFHEKLPSFCIKDINHCNCYKCADFLRKHLKRLEKTNTMLWINISIIANKIIKAIYEKNDIYLNKYHQKCTEKKCFIEKNSKISQIDKNIVLESYAMIQENIKNIGKNVTVNKDFLTFVANYLDYYNNKKSFSEILDTKHSKYHNWLKFIKIKTNKEEKKDFDLLF